MLIECCFCDNAGDMKRYNVENIANAIVKGLIGTTIATPGQPSTNNNGWINLDGKTGTIYTPSGVNVRESKSTFSSRCLPNGEKVNLYRIEGDWIHIYYPPHGVMSIGNI